MHPSNRLIFFLFSTLFIIPWWAMTQDADSLEQQTKGRTYWKDIRLEQKARLETVKDWQRQYVNIPDGRFSMLFTIGYGLPVINQKVEAPYPFLGTGVKVVNVDGSVVEEGIYTTDGAGIRGSLRGRFMINDLAGIELGIGLEWYDRIPNGKITLPTYKSLITSKSYGITLTPQLILSSPNIRNFYVYGRIGIYTPIWGGSRSEIDVTDRNGTLIRAFLDSDLQTLIDFGDLILDYEEILGALNYKATLKADVKVDFYKNLTVMGFQTAVGFRYQFKKNWGVMAEYFHGGYAPFLKSSTVEEFDLVIELLGREILVLNEDGGYVSLLPWEQTALSSDILGSTLNTNYFQSLNQDSNNSELNPDGFDPTQPTDELTDKRLTYSHGIFVGIQYNIPQRSKKRPNP